LALSILLLLELEGLLGLLGLQLLGILGGSGLSRGSISGCIRADCSAAQTRCRANPYSRR
jgi:hypothetical protein